MFNAFSSLYSCWSFTSEQTILRDTTLGILFWFGKWFQGPEVSSLLNKNTNCLFRDTFYFVVDFFFSLGSTNVTEWTVNADMCPFSLQRALRMHRMECQINITRRNQNRIRIGPNENSDLNVFLVFIASNFSNTAQLVPFCIISPFDYVSHWSTIYAKFTFVSLIYVISFTVNAFK